MFTSCNKITYKYVCFSIQLFRGEFLKLYTLSHIIWYPSLYWCPDVKDFNCPTQGRCRIHKLYHHAQYNKTIKRDLLSTMGLLRMARKLI